MGFHVSAPRNRRAAESILTADEHDDNAGPAGQVRADDGVLRDRRAPLYGALLLRDLAGGHARLASPAPAVLHPAGPRCGPSVLRPPARLRSRSRVQIVRGLNYPKCVDMQCSHV